MRLSRRRPSRAPQHSNSEMTTRERTIGLVSAFIHNDHGATGHFLPYTKHQSEQQALDLALVAAALLINWSNEAGIDPKDLLSDIALGQALDATTR